MDLLMEWPKFFKLIAKWAFHKIRQYRLSTGHTIVLDTNYGKVCGLQRKTVYDPPEPWQGVLKCTYNRSKPLQRNMTLGFVEGSEDCLHLNIYVKTLISDQKLPVIVWIYGGGFQKGEASRDIYSPDYFMKKPVVLITFNYRLGALGFLSFKDPQLNIPGNAGLKDQVQALRWISQNIAHFNGDPSNITLAGGSAGASCVDMLMTTEQTRGLFHKAILQSGCALSEWVTNPQSNWGLRLAQNMGYRGGEQDVDVFRFLKQFSSYEIASCDQNIVTEDEVRSFLLYAFGPVVEPYETDHCVVPRRHKDQLPEAWGNHIPIIMGGNSFEGLFCYQMTRDDLWFLRNFHNILPREVSASCTTEERDLLVRRIKKHYFSNEEQQAMGLFEALNICSHRQIWHDMHRLVLARRTYAPETPTYLYRFGVDSPHFHQFRWIVCGDFFRGACHADELSYLFYTVLATHLDKSSEEYQTIERMVGMWTSFAGTGNPNCREIGDAKWEPLQRMESGVERCFNISQELDMRVLPEADSMAMWDSLYPNEALF